METRLNELRNHQLLKYSNPKEQCHLLDLKNYLYVWK